MPEEGRLERRCLRCGEAFSVQRVTARYCSNACRQMAYLDRHEPPAPDDGGLVMLAPTQADWDRWLFLLT